MVLTLTELLEHAAERFPTAFVSFDDDHETYPELLESARTSARRLAALGVKPGEKVGIFAGDRPEYLWALYGAILLGAVAVPVNGRFKVRELRHAITNAELKVLFTGGGVAGHATLVVQALTDVEHPPHVINWDAEPDFSAEADYEPAHTDAAMLLYTSGTTAMPKGCVLPHAALVRPAYAMRDRFALTDEDRMWDALPLFHLASLLPLHACMVAGASYCATRHFDPAAALAQMEKERRTTAFPAFETLWLAVLNHPDFATTDLSAMRLVLNVGTRERLEQMQARMPHALQISSYGCTELGGVCCFGHIEDPLELRTTTSGRPFPGMEIRIIDPETGADAEIGEIICRGPNMFSGYHGEPELMAAVVDEQGFFHTGDLGSLDPGGRLSYRGRLKDMLKVGGENVGAAEIEGHLSSHPAVDIVQVVGVRDARYDEVPVAFVQLRTGATATETELIAHCLGAIATFKVPRYVRFVSAWPMSGTKIQKFRLREQITAELDAAGIAEAPKLSTAANV